MQNIWIVKESTGITILLECLHSEWSSILDVIGTETDALCMLEM